MSLFLFVFEVKANLRFTQSQMTIPTQGRLSIPSVELETTDRLKLTANPDRQFWDTDDLLGVCCEDNNIFGIFEVDSEQTNQLSLIYLSSDQLRLDDDRFYVLDLERGSGFQPEGTTLIWRHKKSRKKMHQKYLPLFTQGSVIGDTAHTLPRSDFHINTLGTLSMGMTNWLSIGLNIPAYTLGSPNGRLKANFYENQSQSWALATSIAQERNSDQKLVNLDLIWDSVLTENLVAHSILSVAVVTFDEASGVAALRSYGSSTIQTGYEIVLDDWNRILAGPSYNVENEAIGGYFSYIHFYDSFYIQLSLTSNNVRELKFSSEEGYLPYIELAWRW